MLYISNVLGRNKYELLIQMMGYLVVTRSDIIDYTENLVCNTRCK